ncbi:MAG TPA: PaaI family thioesterase [Syntrophomonadaceae bacterium]|nr:PaaI family thioesterase [Syntrophomonadaceae bacterium]
MQVKNQGIDQDLFAYIVDSVKNTPYYNLLGVRVSELGPGCAEFTVNTAKVHTNPMGIIHGGLYMSMADAAMGNAVRSLGIRGVTCECSIQILASTGLEQTVAARGQVMKAGRNLIFVRAEVRTGDTLLCCCQGSFFNTGQIDPHH